jgi:DNA-binding CsgD family transcriptional regulator/tetratricopeptide (TPR) repeat protein
MVGSGSADEPLVAREAELSHVLSAHSAVATGSGRLVLLTGEPGIGKTRLATEVLARAHALGNLVLVGRCFEQYTTVPFFPFTELLGAALNVAPAELKTEATVRWPELVYLTPDSIPASPQKLEGPEAQLRLFRATLSFLQALADVKPLVLLLEDVHWADATSLALLLFLGRHLDAARMLILGTYRDVEVGRQHPLEATVRELLRERVAEEMHLRRLAAEGTAALICAQLGVASVSDELVTLVHGRAQGNPFFTEELLTAFVEKGALATGEDRVGLAGIEELEVPRSIRSVIGERIGRLPRQSQELLRLASLLGPDFDLEMLLAVSGQTEADVLDGLDTALEAGIIGLLRRDCEQFAFAHVLIQQTLYEELPVHRRRRMHLRVGQALEHVHAARSTLSADLARHFLLGGEAERAIRYAIEAGDHAASRYAHPEASRQYQVALELLDDLDDPATAAEVQYKLGGELFDMARSSEALAAYEASLGSFRRLNNQRGQALAHWGIARLHEGLYDMASAEPHVNEALRLWPAERQDTEFVRLLSDATRIKAFVGRIAESSDLAERNLALAEQLGDAGLVALALAGMSSQLVGRGVHRGPERRLYLDRAIDLGLQVGNWRTLTLLYIQRGTNRVMTGDLDGCIADRRQAIDAADRSAQMERMTFAYLALGTNLMWTGDWENARAAIRAGLALDPQREHPYSVHSRGLLAWMEGRPEEAAGYFSQFVVNSRHRHDSQGVLIGLAQLATLNVQLDQPAKAEAPSREVLGLLRSWGGLIGFASGPVAEVFVRLGAEDAESVLSELEGLVHECGEELARPQLLRARALLHARQHSFDDALESLDASASLARSMHAVTELAQSLLLLASVARQKGDKVSAAQADSERLAIVEGIGPEARAMAWARGLPHASRTQAAAQGPLSPREWEVAQLIAGGLSNRQIAEALVISERTVENHVSSILARLGVDTRAQVAAWTVQYRLAAPAK